MAPAPEPLAGRGGAPAPSQPPRRCPTTTPSDAPSELWRLGAGQLAALIRGRRASSREVVQAHLARIAQVNPGLRAITVVLAEPALAAADEADRALAAGRPVGPLHGVPFTVKENIDVAGSATTQGVAALAGAVPPVDAPHIASLRAAGAIPLGRTNMPDFGLRWHTDNALWGATRNPWDAARTPGGSSGGEAVALATGLSPLGVGNDMGGSLRWPAQCCGVAALKPSLGRVPRGRSLPPLEQPLSSQLLSVQGPLARHVADLRLALEQLSRPDWRDPWYAPVPLRGAPPDLPIRVAVVEDPAGGGVDPDIRRGVQRAAAALQDQGYAVEALEPPGITRAAEAWRQVLGADLPSSWARLAPLVSAGARRSMAISDAAAPPVDAATAAQAFQERQALARDWAHFQLRHPLILAPVGTRPPFPVGADLRAAGFAALRHSLRMVLAANLLGLPAAAVPVGVAAGLPLGVQLIGPRFRDDLCLDAAEAVERTVGPLTPLRGPWP